MLVCTHFHRLVDLVDLPNGGTDGLQIGSKGVLCEISGRDQAAAMLVHVLILVDLGVDEALTCLTLNHFSRLSFRGTLHVLVREIGMNVRVLLVSRVLLVGVLSLLCKEVVLSGASSTFVALDLGHVDVDRVASQFAQHQVRLGFLNFLHLLLNKFSLN